MKQVVPAVPGGGVGRREGLLFDRDQGDVWGGGGPPFQQGSVPLMTREVGAVSLTTRAGSGHPTARVKAAASVRRAGGSNRSSSST